jgi:hypothetical protein
MMARGFRWVFTKGAAWTDPNKKGETGIPNFTFLLFLKSFPDPLFTNPAFAGGASLNEVDLSDRRRHILLFLY